MCRDIAKGPSSRKGNGPDVPHAYSTRQYIILILILHPLPVQKHIPTPPPHSYHIISNNRVDNNNSINVDSVRQLFEHICVKHGPD